MARVHVNKHCACCGEDLEGEEDVVLLADIEWSDRRQMYKPYRKPRELVCKDEDAILIKFKNSTKSRNVYCDVFCLFKDLSKHPELQGRTVEQ